MSLAYAWGLSAQTILSSVDLPAPFSPEKAQCSPRLTGAIRRIVGRGPEILDGSHGVAMQLGRRLAAAGMLRTQGGAGTVEFRNSLDEPEILALSRTLLQYRED